MAGLGDAAAELQLIARHLRDAGERELVRDLTAAMRQAVAPVGDEIRAGLRPHLPDRYADTLNADLRIRSSVRQSRDPGVSIVGTPITKKRKLPHLDAGLLTHPLFGDRDHWYTQEEPSVKPGWFTGPAEDAAPQVRAELEKALQDVADRAASKAPLPGGHGPAGAVFQDRAELLSGCFPLAAELIRGERGDVDPLPVPGRGALMAGVQRRGERGYPGRADLRGDLRHGRGCGTCAAG